MVGGRDGGRGGRHGGRQPSGRGRGRGRGPDTRNQGGRGRGRGQDNANQGRPNARAGGYRPPQLPLNPSNLQFVRSVLKNCPNYKLKETIEHMDKAWLSSWQGVESLPVDAVKMLLSALARLPFSASIDPPPLPAISKAVAVLLSQMTDGESSLDGNDDTLEGVELVERVVARLLKFTWNLKRDDVKDALAEMIAQADGSLSIRVAAHRPVRSRLGTLLNEMEKSWIIKVKVREWTEVESTEDALPDWRHPTVAWLADYRNFQPTLLPKLQKLRTTEGRVYESTEEYFVTIVKLWIGMTFVEGNNALLPHCTVKMGDKVCDQPLWPFPGKEKLLNCKNSQCDRYATFLCAHRLHAKGYCSKCATEYQQRLRGPPSKYASTHIYDGVISSVKYDGTISLEQIESRRPPLNPIHWRTTKRLSSPNLVGIVRLTNRDASLRTTDEVFWAEITFQGKSGDEFKAREKGCMTLRLLQYLDEPGNKLMAQNPSVGDAVAIVDCQTFVPEFIPVLIALEKQRQLPVPFQNGALLNLSNEALAFEEGRSDYENENDSEATMDSDLMASLPTLELIRKVIKFSLLDPVIDIRRDAALRNRLEHSLLSLVNSATLDPGQLKSFAEAMMYPVHCTQGPPGTGKSYLGVVVVRALLVVRDLWKQKNREVGDPPILVLSYKNHAIDEFLLDLLRSEPTLNHSPRQTPYFGRYYSGNSFKRLVRIGGGGTEPELEQYRERNVANSDPKVREVSNRIEKCQDLRDQWHKFRDCFAPIFEAQTLVARGTKTLSTDDLKIVQMGVSALSKAVATLWTLSKNVDTEEAKALASDETEEKAAEGDEGAAKSVAEIYPVVNLVLKEKPMLTNADISLLYKGIKHYNPEIDPREVLFQWVSGFRPLPACAYAEPSCQRVCTDGSTFCQEHSCKFAMDGEGFCLESVVHKRLYCKRHLCSAEKCKNCRLDEVQSFCEDHACFVCLARNELAQEAVEEPPRNSCEQHPLCWGLDGMCSEVAEPNASYCKAHTEDLYCKWTSKRGEKCGEIATTGQYCGQHHAEALAASARAAETRTDKCQSRTRKGKPCKSYSLPGSSFCRDHVGRSSQLTTKSPELVLPNSGSNGEVQSSAKDSQELATVERPSLSVEVDESKPEVRDAAADEDEAKAQEDELMSSDSDVEEFVDAVQYDNEDEVEESEHLQHMRDVYEVGDDDVEDTVESVAAADEEEKTQWTAPDQTLMLPPEWHWEMALEERWDALLSVLNLWGDLNAKLQHELAKSLENLKIEHQREILRANSRVYEGKAVIGGTITGCVSRLEAIRTTNPFAILVEEASEVMEPLLFSCFSSSTRKLEMIGDHMQLQPSVMGRIDFERVNKINISMFERLISAPQGNEVPSSVLSIQRRMRKNICDLTRSFYKDITTIEDHQVCGTKRIGGAKRKAGDTPLLDACEGSGREVPGVSPHIFFWTHTGAQQRASVGLSRVNNQEASMTCKLVQYLVHCGVPAKSIAVLTPYKGQLMLMRKMLMNTYGLTTMTKGRDPRRVPSCFLSTVDRFQGDEADIVIISLVIDGKSRTPFVKLQNRMIVLLSRARLGMYVVGNVEYFGQTAHWQKTLTLLEKEAEPDNTEAITDCTVYEGPSIGSALPICCPEHRTSVKLAKEERALKLGFCAVVCSAELPCTHECGLMCHWPQPDKHNKRCAVEVESPCSRHPRMLKCYEVTASSAGKLSIAEALKKYQCDIRVDVSLPCGHDKKMKCHTHGEIVAGRDAWPVCNKTAIAPYVYDECKHILQCTCSEFARYSRGLAPPCSEKVEYSPPCQHTVSLSCHDRQDYDAQVRQLVCKEKVKISLPRCGHETVVSCSIAESLEQWTGDACTTLDFVQEGESYGPKDYFCKRTVKFQRRCGHHEMVRCERAFELAQSPSRCQERVVVANPECGHECSTTCFEKERLYEKVVQHSSSIDDIDPLEVVNEGDASNFRNYGLNVQCSHEVTYVRSCGHEAKMKCSEARHVTAVCEELVTAELPVCGHVVRLPCHLSKHLTVWQPWQAQTPSTQLLHEDSVVVDTLAVPGARPAVLRSILKDCEAPVRFRRTATCGHDIEMKCCDAFKVLQGKQAPNPCTIHVLKELSCGHEVAMKCADKVESVCCQETVDKPCWNFSTCGSKVKVPCRVAADTVQCTNEAEWRCPAGHSFLLRLCSRGVPSDCPQCSSTHLEDLIKHLHRVLSDQKLTLWTPEAARILPDAYGVTHVTMSEPSKREFLIRKMKMLERFKGDQASNSPWTKALFSPVEFPVFLTLTRKLQSQHIDKFELKDFGNQAFNGIEVYEATQENFDRIVRDDKASVLFGHLFTVKYLKNPVDLPKNKGKMGATLRQWVSRQCSHGYDALYRDAKSGKEGGNWIVWHPYTMFPTHRVDVTDANREVILKALPERSQVEQPPLKITFKKPNGNASVEEEKPAALTPRPSILSVEDLDKLRVLAASVSPLYAKLNVWYPWEGKSLSTGAAEVIPQRMEKTLASKLNFIPATLANAASKNPFGGIKYLQNVQGQGKLKEDGNLFMALELLAVRKRDTAEVRAKLEEYVTRICSEDSGYAHPLVLIAIARLAVRLSHASSSDVHRKLIEMFAKLYPEASAVWLSDAEAEHVKAVTSPATSAILSGPVSVEDKWEALKTQFGCRSEDMEKLLKLVGLKKVKQAAVNLFKNAMVLQQLSATQRRKNAMSFNYCFVGNPGTGKTTVARLFANVLKDSKIRRTNTFVECTAQQLKDDGAAEFRLKLQQAVGGVLFIDEAYELDPAGDFKGKPIVAELLTAAEDKRDDLSIILAGYEDDIQKKLYAYNDGLPSRFEEVVFEDFDAQDLEVVWDGIAQDRGWDYEEAIAKVACRRLAKAAGRKGFGNARAVRKLFEQAVKEAMAREDFDGTFKFETVDLLGDRPSTNPKLRAVLNEVEEKTGWRKIKDEMKTLVRISDENYERELKGQETVPLCLNRLFLGNPGTGKTTCAGYYGRVLKALHFLSNGEVVKKTAGDFIGSHVGESQTKTSQILEMAKGKVLVIDEAYNLNDNMYGKQVLDVLVEKVQGTESDDLAVLLIGYENEMLEMLRTQNPGLMRRFPPQHAFQFEDYTEHELLDILEWNCARRSVTCPLDVAEALLKHLALQKTQPNFGNAGAVEQLLKHALGKAMSRPMVNGMTVLTLEDVGAEKESTLKDPLELLDKLYRMDEIKTQLSQLRNQLIVADREGSGRPEVGHFVFRGSPGTGKTTVARVMAEILHGMGVLATTKLVETSGLDLTGEHVGQTKQKVTDKLGEAKGGLLFIDEAYELGKGTYGEEAMTTLVAAMTDPSYAGMVLIVAGYPKDMDQMLDRNVGLKSRFNRFIDFPDWEAQDAVVFVSVKAESENFEVESEAVLSLQHTFVELKKLGNFGNGRDAVRVWKELLQRRSQRVVDEPEEERTITESDAEQAGESVLAARRGSAIPYRGAAVDEDPMKLLDGLYRMDQIRAQLSRLQMEMAVAEREGSERPEIGHFVFRGSPGTGKTTVARVMAQILHAMNALGTTKLVETSGLDLTGEYVGQTKAKVTEKLVEAKGGLLFIDEAYELGKGHFGEEAMTTLVAAMTDPTYAGMVIVIAGYPKDMDVMLNRNAGLKSRFTRFIDFPDWEPEDGVAFLRAKAEREEMKLQGEAETVLAQTFAALKVLDGFGNGRDAVRVWKELKQCRAQRVFDSVEEVRTITAQDAVMAAETVVAARRPPDGPVLSQSSLVKDTSMFRVEEQQPRREDSLCEATKEEESEEVSIEEELDEKEATSVEVEAEEDPEVDEDEKKTKEQRDSGVSDEDWEELERAKEAHAAHLDELRRARDQAKLEEERRRAEAIQEKIRRICPCPAGFKWYKCGGGWRCGGGSHYVSDAQLNSQFTC